jgi:hypothetical protein
MSNEKMELRWNEHGTNAPNTFKQLWGDEDFADVTLATADDRQIKAHKVIISSCSSFFKNILVKNPHPNPLIYLKGITYAHLESALQFIYLGQCDMNDKDISDFLITGTSLGISGLMEELEYRTEETEESKVKQPKSPAVANNIDSDFIQPYQTKSGKYKKNNSSQSEDVKRETLSVPAVWKSDGKYGCNMCDKAFKMKGSLYTHNQAAHEGVYYYCDQCDYKAAQKGNLKTHKFKVHQDTVSLLYSINVNTNEELL